MASIPSIAFGNRRGPVLTNLNTKILALQQIRSKRLLAEPPVFLSESFAPALRQFSVTRCGELSPCRRSTSRRRVRRQGQGRDRTGDHRPVGHGVHRSRRLGPRGRRRPGLGVRRHLLRQPGRRGRMALAGDPDRHRRRDPRDRLPSRRPAATPATPANCGTTATRDGGGLLRRGISTVIPSDLLRVGDELFLHAIVNRGFGNVVWTEIWRSADNGLTWANLGGEVPGRPAPGPRPVLVVGLRPRRRLDLFGIHRLSAQQGRHPAAGAPAASGAAGPLRRLGSGHAALG